MRKSLILAAALMLTAAPAFAGTEAKIQPPVAPAAPAVTQASVPVTTPVASSEVKKDGEIKADATTVSTESKIETGGDASKGKTENIPVVPQGKDLPAKH